MGIFTRKKGGSKGTGMRPGLRERLASRRAASPVPPTARPRARPEAKPAEPLATEERTRRARLLGGFRRVPLRAPTPAPAGPSPLPEPVRQPKAPRERPTPPDRYGQIVRMLRDPDYRNAVKAELEQRREAVRSRQAARLARARARPRKPAPPGAADGVPARPGSRKKK